MSQEERTQLIIEIKELFYLEYESNTEILDDETKKLMKQVLKNLFAMSLI
jgi:hypothetical protein